MVSCKSHDSCSRRRKMISTNFVGQKSSGLLAEVSAHSFRSVREQSTVQTTISVEPVAQFSNRQNERRYSSHQAPKSDFSEHPVWTSSIRRVEQQPPTMSIQFGAQQHQHHHSHSHLHYYAPADVQSRNEGPNQELNYYRTYQDQYYTSQHAQRTDPCRYQSNVMNTNHDSNYSASIQELSASTNSYQSGTIYNQKNGVYCQQHRAYHPHNATSDLLAQEAPSTYPYPNHLHAQHQNYGPSMNNIDSLHNHSRSHATNAMDIDYTNNMGPTRSDYQYPNHDNSSSAGYRDYCARQYNNSSSYQYPVQERYMQIISHSHSTTVDQYQAELRQRPSSGPREFPPAAVILLAKPKKEQNPGQKKRVRDSNTQRQVTLDSKTKSTLSSCRSISLQGDKKSSPKTNLCHICNRHYARPSTLKTHLRTHTNERPYKCTVCHKTFSQAANLTAHQRVHTGERPFPCPICGRQFSQSSSVITHLRTHSGERPYRCNMCHRTFSDSSTLTKHCRIHSGEKPYQCEYCQLNFSQSGNLSRHIRLHLLNGIRNPLRVSTPASETLLQARQALPTSASSNVSIPPSFSSSSSNSSSTSGASF